MKFYIKLHNVDGYWLLNELFDSLSDYNKSFNQLHPDWNTELLANQEKKELEELVQVNNTTNKKEKSL